MWNGIRIMSEESGGKKHTGWWDRMFDDGSAAKWGCTIPLGAGAILLFGYIIHSNQQAALQRVADEQVAAAEKASRGPNEIDTGAICDLAVKGALVSEDSFDPEWGGSFHAEGDIGVMSRKFDSTNALGAKLTSRYTCKWNSRTDTIVSLEVTDPFGETKKLK
ncbi:hypothetical protein NRB_34070 [Novosphingobium sp. 11B]